MPQSNFSISVIRPDDLLKLDFTFINLNLNFRTVPPQLEHIDPNVETFIIIEFPPQHIAEEAIILKQENLRLPPLDSVPKNLEDRFEYLTDSESEAKDFVTPVSSILAKNSRLAFKVPKSIRKIEYSLTSLLDWSNYDLSVAPTAIPRPQVITGTSRVEPYLLDIHEEVNREEVNIISPGPIPKARPFDPITDKFETVVMHLNGPEKPKTFESIIEAPWRLTLSPNKFAGWAHSSLPVSQGSARVELWHTRLGVRKPDGVEENYDYNRTVRAVWTEKYNPLEPPKFFDPLLPKEFRTSLTRHDLWELVRLTSDLTGWEEKIIQANRLMLSSLGAWLNLRYAHEVTDSKITLEEWRHIASMGRDQYVRVVYKGYLLPFGFPASLIRITERMFKDTVDGKKLASLVQRMYVIIRQPKVSYKEQDQMYDGRTNPFKKVMATTLITPDLDPAIDSQVLDQEQSAFWPMVSKKAFKFHIVAEDAYGQNCEFVLPLLFIDNSMTSKSNLSKIIDYYNQKSATPSAIPLDWLICDLFQQKVALAPSISFGSDTTFEINRIHFGLEQAAASAKSSLQCFPTIVTAEINVPAIKQLGGSETPIPIIYNEIYKKNEFKGNNMEAQVFAQLNNPLPLIFSADKCGGIVTPNLNLIGFSRKFGPLSGSTVESLKQLAGEITEPKFNPKDYFSGDNAKLLGGIDLGEIVMDAFGIEGRNVPQIKTTPIYTEDPKGKFPLPPPESIKTELTWKPDVKESGVFKLSSDPINLPTSLIVQTTIITKKDPNESTFTSVGNLTNFSVDLFGFIIVSFNSFKFQVIKDTKLAVDPNVAGVEFRGPLKFVEELQQYLPISGTGFDVNVTPEGATLASTLSIPSIGLGVMTIQNIALSSGLNLPFTGKAARLRFAFCTREHPFILTIYGLGGGGFFGLNLGLDGVESLEASLEFGASVALDIGVASGEVHIMAGIYYKWDKAMGALLEGYLRLGGELDVLGIVSVSVEFYMALVYSSAGNKVWGEASLTVQIRITFFRKSVSLKVRREFADTTRRADPSRITFRRYMSQRAWEEEYCTAFA